MVEKGADPADAGHPGLCLQRCQIRVVSGFGDRLAYCRFVSQIDPLFLRRVRLSIFSTNLNQTEALQYLWLTPTTAGLRTAENAAKILG